MVTLYLMTNYKTLSYSLMLLNITKLFMNIQQKLINLIFDNNLNLNCIQVLYSELSNFGLLA